MGDHTQNSRTPIKTTQNTNFKMVNELSVPTTLRDNFFSDPFFKNAWEDFERIRNEMMRESRAFWERAHKMQESMGFESSNLQNSLESHRLAETTSPIISSASTSATNSLNRNAQSNNQQLSLFNNQDFMDRDFMLPRRWLMTPMMSGGFNKSIFNDDSFFKSLDLFQHSDETIIRVKDDADKFQISLDTNGFKPDELKVNVRGDSLSIEAKHEEKGENKYVNRQFKRMYTLPQGCVPEKVNSNLSSDGVLVITAPKNSAIKNDGNRSIPIEMKR